MERLQRDKIPPGKVQIRKLDKTLGDLVELVDTDKVLVKISDFDIVIDEDTMKMVPKDELQAKVDSGEVKRIRTVPAVAGGERFESVEGQDKTFRLRLKIGEKLIVESETMQGTIPAIKVIVVENPQGNLHIRV